MTLLGSVGAGAKTLLGGLSGGIERGANAFGLTTVHPQLIAEREKMKAEEEERRRQQEALQGFMASEQGQQFMATNPQQAAMLQFGLLGAGDIAASMKGGNKSLTPFFTQDPDGNYQAFQLDSSGGALPLSLPDGHKPFVGGARTFDERMGTRTADQNTAYGIEANKTQGQQDVKMATQPGIDYATTTAAQQALTDTVGGKVSAEVLGRAAAESAAGAPQEVENMSNMLATLNQAIAHPGRQDATGKSGALNPLAGTVLRGGDRADYLAIQKQMEGKTFLQAFESLKGGGQITEIEGKKATEAIARLDTAQSYEAHTAALEELRGIVSRAMERQQDYGSPESPATKPQQRGVFNPQTGQIEWR